MFIALAARFYWTPEQILEMTPDFLDELTCYLNAEARKAEIDLKRLKKDYD